MAKTREIACVHYLCEGNCDLGKDGIFRGHCQTCPSYKKSLEQSLLEPTPADKRLKEL